MAGMSLLYDFRAAAEKQSGIVPVRFKDGGEGFATGPQRDGSIAVQRGIKTSYMALGRFALEVQPGRGGTLIEI